MSDRAEVVVVGAGIVGAATAAELHARGVDVLLLDREDAVSAGTTGLGEGNVLCGDKAAGPELELAKLGLAVYDDLEADLGAVARIRRKGALVVHPDVQTWAAEPARVAALGVEHETLDAAAVREREPALTGPLHGATCFPRDLQCDPAAIVRALAARLRVRTGCRVEAIATTGGSPSGAGAAVAGVRTDAGPIAADAVVLAAGVWSGPLAAAAGVALPLAPRKGQLVTLRVPDCDRAAGPWLRHKVIDGSYLRSVGSAAPALELSTVLETTWAGDVLVGSSRERCGFDVTVDPTVSRALVERAARLAPGLRGLATGASWAGLRPWLPDHLPAIGEARSVRGLWIATGHEGAGVGLGPVTGRLVADGIGGRAWPLDPAPFDPNRFTAVAAAER